MERDEINSHISKLGRLAALFGGYAFPETQLFCALVSIITSSDEKSAGYFNSLSFLFFLSYYSELENWLLSSLEMCLKGVKGIVCIPVFENWFPRFIS
jgi:hypothetical protein